jgi:hypothetical protein
VRVDPNSLPAFVGALTLGIGSVLLVVPRVVTGPLGLTGQEGAVRAIGASDLLLVPGLLRGNPRWPWMGARAAFNVGVAAYLVRVADSSSSPAVARGGAGGLLALTAVDAAAALRLRRQGA